MASQAKSKSTKIIILAIIAIIVGLVVWLPLINRNTSLSSNGEYAGTLTSVDTSEMATDGPGVYKLMANREELTVHVDAGESACDRTAITVPDVRVGDTVQVKGNKGADGIVRICGAGSYIRR